jgi:hypothetical protein
MKRPCLQRRVQWRPGDREHNEALAIDVFDSSTCDDLIIALNLIGWQLVPSEGRRRRWALHGAVPAGMQPDWTISVRDQDAEIAAGMLAEGDTRSRAHSRRAKAKQPPWKIAGIDTCVEAKEQPWKAAGVSKATWYRWRAAEAEARCR